MSLKIIFRWLFVKSLLARLTSSSWLGTVAAVLTGLYYGAVSTWGNDWIIIKNYKNLHQNIYIFLGVMTCGILLFRSITEAMHKSYNASYSKLMERLFLFTGKVVFEKKQRFFKSFNGVPKHKKNIFALITQPTDQIKCIMSHAKDLLVEGFGLEKNSIEMTVIAGYPQKGTWWYEVSLDDQRQHTKAETILNGNSVAKYVLTTGESFFLSDLRKGIQESIFLETNRSRVAASKGSIYCKPVKAIIGTNEPVNNFV